MTAIPISIETTSRIRLKDGETFFAAGSAFDQALSILSDGTFKMFTYLCLRADRRTGRYEATLKELAASLKKSKRIIGCYTAEVRTKGICKVQMGTNQYARTCFEISEEYWPYVRLSSSFSETGSGNSPEGSASESDSQQLSHERTRHAYIKAIRDSFVSLGCTRGVFRAADGALAGNMFNRGIPLEVVTDALVVGALRKYSSWLNGNAGDSIASLKYFEAIIDELLENPLPPCYAVYAKEKLKTLQGLWQNRFRRALPSENVRSENVEIAEDCHHS